MRDDHARILLERANAILERGTLVWDRKGSTVAYAFVVPIELRDDLADIIADIDLDEAGRVTERHSQT